MFSYFKKKKQDTNEIKKEESFVSDYMIINILLPWIVRYNPTLAETFVRGEPCPSVVQKIKTHYNISTLDSYRLLSLLMIRIEIESAERSLI